MSQESLHNLEKKFLETKSLRSKKELFNHMVALLSKKLYWRIRGIVQVHEDADDLLQNTFIKVWGNLNQFKGNSSIFTWAYRIATNEALNFIKSKYKRNHLTLQENQEWIFDKLTEDPFIDSNQTLKLLWMAINKLPDKQKTVFKLRYFEELSFSEIAEITNTSVGSLKASYHHAFEKVKKTILDQDLI